MKKILDLTKQSRRYFPLIIAITYFAIGIIWVGLSRRLIRLLVIDADKVLYLQELKDLSYLFLPSILVYFLVKGLYKDIYFSKSQIRENERRLRAVFDAAEETSFIILKKDGNGLIVSEFSPGSERIFGYRAEEVIGKSFFAFYTIQSEEKFEHSVNLLNQGKTVSYESVLVRASGEKFQASTTIYPLLDSKNNYVGSLVVTIDISNYKKTEEELKETTALLKATLDNIPDVIGVQDMAHSVIQYNKAGCNLFNTNITEILGKKCYEILGYVGPCNDCATAETYRTRKPAKVERYEENLGVWLDIRTYPILNENGDIIKIIEHMRDITERKKSEELLKINNEVNKKLLDEIVEYDKIKTEFFSNISHELRTPLSVIYSALQLVDKYHREGKMNAEAVSMSKYIATMKQNSYRLLRLINNLIDITRIDSGFYKMKLENYNIVNIVEEITMSVANYIENKSIKLEFDTDTEEKIMAVDADKIERIMLNLLSNAAKFTNADGRIWVNLFDKGKSVVIAVKDCGVGIPQEKIGVIFERFRQVDSSLTRSHEGSGIGLSLVQSFVEMHGGSIEVESKVGEGSTFIIELPVIVLPEEETQVSVLKTKNDYVDMISIEFSDIYFGNIA